MYEATLLNLLKVSLLLAETQMHLDEMDVTEKQMNRMASDMEAMTKPRPDPMRASYERFCADLKRNLPPVEAEHHLLPTFEEFKLAYQGDDHA